MMTKTDNNNEISLNPTIDLNLPIREIGNNGWQRLHELAADEREQLARELELIEITSFKTHLAVTPQSGGKFHLKASIDAAIKQQSAISLQPITRTVEEDFHLTFAPVKQVSAAQQAEIELSLEDESPELFEGDSLDLGQIIYEHFAISLEQYPKNKGETFVWENKDDEPEETRENPFTVLKTLQKPPKNQ